MEIGRGQFHHVSTGVHGKEWAGKTLNAKKMVVFIIGLFIKGEKGRTDQKHQVRKSHCAQSFTSV